MNGSEDLGSGPVARACAHALLGEAADSLDVETARAPEDLLSQLREQGWGAPRIDELRAHRQREGQPWPVESSQGGLRAVGFAQLHAWVSQCVHLLGFDAVDAGVRDAQTPLDAEDRRLLSECPPHHGSVG